jgi:hypothetical protein
MLHRATEKKIVKISAKSMWHTQVEQAPQKIVDRPHACEFRRRRKLLTSSSDFATAENC